MCVCAYVFICYLCIYIYMHVYTHEYIYIHMYVHMYMNGYVHVLSLRHAAQLSSGCPAAAQAAHRKALSFARILAEEKLLF